jgi:hypothetical protein
METQQRRLFLSYGRKDAAELVERLVTDLEAATAQKHPRYLMWRDRPEIQSGIAFMDQIAAALRSVDGLVAIMSPHSVRTRATSADAIDSVCLDEISYARFGAKKPIVPAMAVPCEPPLEIFRLDYVDFTNWKQGPDYYQQAFAKLLDGIAAALRGEQRFRRWDDRLQPWEFGSFLAEKRSGFTGRDWLFDDIRAWMEEASAPPLLIVGDPGIGKSAIVAELVHRNPEGRVVAFHCCQSNVPETLRPGRFVRSVAAMIASRHPKYEEMLDRPLYRELLAPGNCDNDPESAFEQGILEALSIAGSPGEGRRMLVVDALDEAPYQPDATPGAPQPAHSRAAVSIVKLLADRLDRFPKWLALLATTRDETDVLDSLSRLKARVLRASDPKNLRDLEMHISGRLAMAPLAELLEQSGKSQHWVVTTLAAIAQGNFLYARQTLEAIERNLIGFSDIGQLPPGLKQQYLWFFGRQFVDAGSWTAVESLLEVLVAAQEPIGEPDLSAASGLEREVALPRALKSIGQYLRGGSEMPPMWDLFHRSLIEWLTDAKRRGKPYFISVANGHRRLVNGLYARYRQNRLDLSPYTLSHLATHLAEAARTAEPSQRVPLEENLLRFVLDDAVHEQRLDDPLGVDLSMRLAVQAAVDGPPTESVPIAFEAALGRQTFHCNRLDASRLFQLARAGSLDAFERELQLYPADDQWSAAARRVAAWLALDANRSRADEMRRATPSHTVLDERVDAQFEGRVAQFAVIDDHPSESEIADIFRHAGGKDLERVNPSMLWDQAAPPPTGRGLDPEGTRYLAEFHAPPLVAYAQDQPLEGTERVKEYIALNTANAYRVYRVGSLWQILQAVSRHRDPRWVLEMAPSIIAAALAGRDRDVVDALDVTLKALRTAASPASQGRKASVEALSQELERLRPQPPQGDSWGAYRRSLGGLAEAMHVLDLGNPFEILSGSPAIAPGFAGFQSPTCLAFAESIAICGGPAGLIGQTLRMSATAAQNVQDLVFCSRTVSRVNAMTRRWWKDPIPNEAALAKLINTFVADPRAGEFAALHVVGDTYPERRTVNPTSRLPKWLLEAKTLETLSRVYQWSLPDFIALNPEIESKATVLPDGANIRVPDPHWAPQLASFFSSLVLRRNYEPREQVRLILQLVPTTVGQPGDRTALATVLSRLLLALRPSDDATLTRLEQAFAAYGGADQSGAESQGVEPVIVP